MRRSIWFFRGLLAVLLVGLLFRQSPAVQAQAAQIQAALRQFLQTPNTWTALQTFSGGITVSSCTGCGEGGGGAPTDATYVTQTTSTGLTNEQALSALSTGIMRVATTTGVVTSLTNSAGIAANISDETGSGVLVFATSPTLTTPNLGTPSTLVLTNATGTPSSIGLANGTGLPIGSGVSGLGTGIATALGVNVGSAGAPVLFNGALGTPSSGVATNLTGTAAGLTAGTASAVAVGGITGLGTGVATWLATPSSANLASAVTGETGSGALVFGTSPTIATPSITLGTDTNVCFSDGGTLACNDVALAWDKTNDILTVAKITATEANPLTLVRDAFSASMYLYDDGSFEIDGDSAYFYFADGRIFAPKFTVEGTGDGALTVSAANSAALTVVGGGTFGNGLAVTNGITSTSTVTANSGFRSNTVITSVADPGEEPTTLYNVLSINIGTGFAQSMAPTPRAWFSDWALQGPIALKPELLNGLTMAVNNYYNGSPNDSASGGIWVVTKPGSGGDLDATHGAATTYAMDVGVGVVGYSTGGNVGWTTAFKAGGFGSGWHESGTASKIGTGMDIEGYTTRGIYIHGASGSPTASIEADGLIKGGTIQPSTAYKSVDGSTGATVTTCTSFKNGLCVAGT